MKITHIIFSLQVGGAESMLVDIIEEQIRLGHDIQLIIVNNEINILLESTIHSDVKIIKLDRPEGSKNPYFLFKLYFVLHRLKSDIIHCHNVFMGKILKYYKGQKIITVHDTRLYNSYLKNFDQIVSISRAVHNNLKQHNNCKSIIIHNGITTDTILRKRVQTFSDTFNIIQVSRLDHEKKGQDIAIKALYILYNKHNIKNLTLTFIGAGPSKKYLKELAFKMGLSDNVIFLGLKNKTYIYEHLKDYDLLIQPSRYEGFGLTIIEGMAAKLPVLVSNIEGPMEVIQNGNLGISFESENSEDLAHKISELIIDPNINMVNKAYTYTIKNYSIENTVKNYIQLYENIL